MIGGGEKRTTTKKCCHAADFMSAQNWSYRNTLCTTKNKKPKKKRFKARVEKCSEMKTCDYNGFKSEKYNNNKKDKTTHKQKSAQEIRHDSDALKR